MDGFHKELTLSMCRYIGQTVTIFTTSGGLSGSGFTGVLLSVSDCEVRILSSFGMAPACPVGSECTGAYGSWNNVYGCQNQMGAISVIPIHRIDCFVHIAL